MVRPDGVHEAYGRTARRRPWGDHRPGLWFADEALTHHEVAAGAAARAALLADLLPPGAEPHLGVLLDNTPEYPLWLSAAALAGAAVAGINPTRRGPELARDILHTECRILVTERAHLPLLDGLRLPGVRILVTDTEEYAALVAPYAGAEPDPSGTTPSHRLLLSFTSGSTGAPKTAICSQGRLAAAGRALADRFGVARDDVHNVCMPMFHGNAVIADWAPALVAGAGVALRRRFSASRFLDDVRAYGATYFTYAGRAVSYVLATEPRPDDHDNPLRTGFGTEAGAVDAAAFERRFGVRLVEGYGSSEGGAAIQRTPGTPPGAIGRAAPGDDLAVVRPAQRCRTRLDHRPVHGRAAARGGPRRRARRRRPRRRHRPHGARRPARRSRWDADRPQPGGRPDRYWRTCGAESRTAAGGWGGEAPDTRGEAARVRRWRGMFRAFREDASPS
nr:AMP-binding protein [Streptomyces sp. HM190]